MTGFLLTGSIGSSVTGSFKVPEVADPVTAASVRGAFTALANNDVTINDLLQQMSSSHVSIVYPVDSISLFGTNWNHITSSIASVKDKTSDWSVTNGVPTYNGARPATFQVVSSLTFKSLTLGTGGVLSVFVDKNDENFGTNNSVDNVSSVSSGSAVLNMSVVRTVQLSPGDFINLSGVTANGTPAVRVYQCHLSVFKA